MPKQICLVTGPMVGLRSGWFIQDTIDFARRVGEKIVAFNLFDTILEQENIQTGNAFEKIAAVGEILDGYVYQFQYMREKAYLTIGREIERLDQQTSVLVRVPASIKWRGLTLEFKDHRIIAQTIRPDRIVTLIDAEWKIERRLKTDYGQHALAKIAHQADLTIGGILDWLGTEVSVSEDWAEWCSVLTKKKVRHLVLGMETPDYRRRDHYVRDVELRWRRQLPSQTCLRFTPPIP